MMNLRTKLFMGFGGMLSLLIFVSILGIAVITWYTHAIEQVLRENYDSVIYGQRMVDALDQLTTDAQFLTYANKAMDADFTARQNAARALFEKNLAAENANITLPGEKETADHVSVAWAGYLKQLDGVLAAGLSDEQRRKNFDALLPIRTDTKTAAIKIINMNLDHLISVNGQAKEWASWSRTILYVSLAAGIVLGGLLIAFVGRWILQPVRALTRSVREIEAGNLNLVVPVHSGDEVGQLAEAFNSMTTKLRAFRETDQAKLLRTQQTTQLAIDSLPDAVAVINPDGAIEMANGTALRLFNLRPGVTVHETHHEWLMELFRTVRDQQRNYDPLGYSSALQVFDNGTERFFLPQGVPIKNVSGRLIGVTLVLIDVTRLRQIDEVKSSLVSTVSHELRTPLTAIRLANHLLLSDRIGALNPKQTEVALESRDNADRLQRIIENLLDMSRMESGGSLLELAPISPHELIVEAADQIRAAARGKGVSLDMRVPVELPRVNADRARVNHVLMNLLNNALRYTPTGGKISVDATTQDGVVAFSVHDNGQGIPKAYQSRLFERFFRVPGQSSSGVGLGLAIARDIVQAHGGPIQVESEEGVGTTFRFTLPQAPAKEDK